MNSMLTGQRQVLEMKRVKWKIFCVGLVGTVALFCFWHTRHNSSGAPRYRNLHRETDRNLHVHRETDRNLHVHRETESKAAKQVVQDVSRLAPPPPPAPQPPKLPEISGKTSSSASKRSSLGYVLTLKYTGQMVAGLRGISSQQCWLRSFMLPMTIVEPFVETEKSLFAHSPSLWSGSGLQLSNYYRLADVNMTSWDTFLREAPRKMIVVQVKNIYKLNCVHFNCKYVDPAARLSGSMKCFLSPPVREAVNYLKARGFEVVRQVCIDCLTEDFRKINPRYFGEFILGEYHAREVTVLFDAWKFSFEIAPDCKQSASACPKTLDFLSHIGAPPSLNQDASRYLEVIDDLQDNSDREISSSIGVMVRLEWFLIKHRENSLEMIRDCLDQVKTTTKRLAGGGNDRVVLALDVGRYGSGSFGATLRLNHISDVYFETVLGEVKDFVQLLYDGKLTFDMWENSYAAVANDNSDRSYIATLQSEVASRAKCLVLMGGGHFQALALKKYVTHNPLNHDCMYKICHDDNV